MTVKGTMCPHRGIDLSGITPDDAGVITCPLHGLRWLSSTGNIVMPAPTPQGHSRDAETYRSG